MRMNQFKVLVIACLFSLMPFLGYTQNFDVNLLKSINQAGSDFKDDYSKTVSNTVKIYSLAAPTGIFVAGLLKHDKKLQKEGAFMMAGFIGSTIITQGMKRIIKRDRPYLTHPFIVKRVEADGYAMPSGHTSSAFYTSTYLCVLFPKWYVIVPASLYAVSAGYARMYQGVHYPTDVFAGAVLGAGSAWLSQKASKWLEKRSAGKNLQTSLVPF